PHHGGRGRTLAPGCGAWPVRVSPGWMMGVRPAWEGLRVRPCLPRVWKGFQMTRRFRGSDYDITVRVGGSRGRELRVDGKVVASDLVPAFGDGRRHTVELTLPGQGARARRH